jgi:hypothetical protein
MLPQLIVALLSALVFVLSCWYLALQVRCELMVSLVSVVCSQGVNFGKSVPWATKVPATRKDPAAVVSALFRPSSSKGQQKQSINKVAVS